MEAVMASSEERPEVSERVRLMAAALDRVLKRLPDTIDRTEEMRREVALFIVDQFRLGEHDPDRLSDLALAELGPGGGDAAALVPGTEATSEPVSGQSLGGHDSALPAGTRAR
jgi:fermentation-respiration switch protein FrsA (DUF1100 family)